MEEELKTISNMEEELKQEILALIKKYEAEQGKDICIDISYTTTGKYYFNAD